MIIQNVFGDRILKLSRIFGIYALAMSPLPGVIIIRRELSAWEERTLICHEKMHQSQMKRYLYIGWYILYLYQFLKYGYRDMPLEKEAREEEERC